MNTYKLLLLQLPLLLIVSCAKDNGFRMTTNTFANREAIPQGFTAGSSFSISTKQKGESLFSQEVAQKVVTILKNKGFKTKTSGADYRLNFSFAMRKSTQIKDVPVFIPDYGHWHYNHYHHQRYHYGYTVAYVPREYTLFNKILLVEVFKNGNDKSQTIPIWQGTTNGYDEDSNLRDDIDYLLVTVFKYFGLNTRKYIQSKMNENNEEVQNLRESNIK